MENKMTMRINGSDGSHVLAILSTDHALGTGGGAPTVDSAHGAVVTLSTASVGTDPTKLVDVEAPADDLVISVKTISADSTTGVEATMFQVMHLELFESDSNIAGNHSGGGKSNVSLATTAAQWRAIVKSEACSSAVNDDTKIFLKVSGPNAAHMQAAGGGDFIQALFTNSSDYLILTTTVGELRGSFIGIDGVQAVVNHFYVHKGVVGFSNEDETANAMTVGIRVAAD